MALASSWAGLFCGKNVTPKQRPKPVPDTTFSQMNPNVSWLVSARQDLVEDYNGLKQPEKAAKFQAEIAALKANTLPAPARK